MMRPQPRPTPESAAVRGYYARLQRTMLERGLLRSDTAPDDAPINARILAQTFITIALYDEYAETHRTFVARQTADHLYRWAAPVHMALTFGASIPEAERLTDTATVTTYAARLSRLTHLPITLAAEPANFHVLVLNEDERRAAAPLLRALIPGIGADVIRTVTEMPLSTYCVAFAFPKPGTYTYGQALAVIRGEHPDLMRRACYHEELAQALGPANDSPHARPSIFNDDQEFALLTKQDELILRMLYDPRLTPGMTPDQARPIAQRLASKLLGGNG